MALTIDVVSDVVCPWCYIGKRKLETALTEYQAAHPDAEAPRVTWHPFQLNPDLPPEGIERSEYLKRKFGSERAEQVYARVKAVGEMVGIPFAFERVVRQPNTLAAHSLIALAADEGKQDELVEALFRAYFLEGRDLTSNDTLRDIAIGVGLQPAAVERVLDSDSIRNTVASSDAEARKLGIQGVPFFIFNKTLAVSGAQDPSVLLRAMSESASNHESR